MIRNYFKMAYRSLLKRRSTSFINIFGIAIGMGCTILIYLFISHHLSYDNFHDHSDRIYRHVTLEQTDEIEYEASIPPGFPDTFKNDYPYSENTAKIVDWEEGMVTLSETDYKLKEQVYFASPEFFEIFNFPLNTNQVFKAQLDAPNTALITESIGRKLFGDVNPIGETFVLENLETIKITGVLNDFPRNSLFNSGIFVSIQTLDAYNEFLSSNTWNGISSSLQAFSLLRPNQDISSIENQLKPLVEKHRSGFKNVHTYKLQALNDIHLDGRFNGGINSNILWILGLIGFFLLLVACINFINIATAQSIYRSKEIGVRKVLGGQRNQLFWQFMIETFLVTLVAYLFALVICAISLELFNKTFSVQLRMSDLLTWEFAFYSFALLSLVTLLAGSYPGLLLTRIGPIMALKQKLSQNDAGGIFTRKVLVVSQFVISIILIIATLVVNDQIKYAVESDLGFDTSEIVMLAIPDEIENSALKTLKNDLLNHSGVENVSACFASPGAGYNQWGTSVNYNNRPENEEFSIEVKFADKDYLKTFDLKLLSGRNFFERDSVNELIVNATFAKKVGLSNTEDLLGKKLKVSGDYVQGEIVGVIEDFHDQDFQQNINPIVIAPVYDNFGELAIKMKGKESRATLAYIEDQWSNRFPDFIFEYDFLDERVAQLYAEEDRFLSLTRLFSLLAIFIGCLGIYGLITFYVAQRTKEIGIRKVLGGTVLHILGLFTKDFLKLGVIAGIIAIPIGYYVMNLWLENYVYRTQINWLVFFISVGTVLLLTFVIIAYKGLGAATTNPAKSLRTE